MNTQHKNDVERLEAKQRKKYMPPVSMWFLKENRTTTGGSLKRTIEGSWWANWEPGLGEAGVCSNSGPGGHQALPPPQEEGPGKGAFPETQRAWVLQNQLSGEGQWEHEGMWKQPCMERGRNKPLTWLPRSSGLLWGSSLAKPHWKPESMQTLNVVLEGHCPGESLEGMLEGHTEDWHTD